MFVTGSLSVTVKNGSVDSTVVPRRAVVASAELEKVVAGGDRHVVILVAEFSPEMCATPSGGALSETIRLPGFFR